MNRSASSVIDRVVGVCFMFLVGAAALFIAVRLIEAVWTALLVIIGVGMFIGLSVVVLHSQRSGW